MKLLIFNSKCKILRASFNPIRSSCHRYVIFKEIHGIIFIHFLGDVYSMTTKTCLIHKTSLHAPAGYKTFVSSCYSSVCVRYFNFLPNLPGWPAVNAIVCREIKVEGIAHNENAEIFSKTFLYNSYLTNSIKTQKLFVYWNTVLLDI